MQYLIAILFLFLSCNAFAIFCPTNFSSINFGDTTDTVLQMCGNPNSKRSYNQSILASQKWVYYVKTQPFSQITQKISFIFNKDRLASISVPNANPQVCEIKKNGGFTQTVCTKPMNRVHITSTNLCGQIINIGDTTQYVRAACGKPLITNEQPDWQNHSTKVTEFHYAGSPQVILVFENGRLKSRK